MFPTFTEFVLNRCVQLEIKRGKNSQHKTFAKHGTNTSQIHLKDRNGKAVL